MILFAKTKQNDGFGPIDEGIHGGVIINVIDLGTQKNEIFYNETRKVLITWELPNETINIDGEERPRLINKIYTCSLHEKAKLRNDLEAIRGKKFTSDELENGFDIYEMLGSNCQLLIEHNDSGYANIVSVMAIPNWTGTVVATSLEKTYEINDDLIPVYIPKWIQKIIKRSKEYNKGVN